MIIAIPGTPVKAATPAPYTPPTEKYFPRDNDFTDHAAPTLTGAEVKTYDEIVRLCDRKTGYCAFDQLSIANKAKLGYSTVRAAAIVLEARGFIAKRPQRRYKGEDTQGREHWRGGEVHFQVLAKECWQIIPKSPRKLRGKPRIAAAEDALAPRSLAEIKQRVAYFQQERAENKRSKQDWCFKTHSQDKQHRARKNSPPAEPEHEPLAVAAAVAPDELRFELRSDDTHSHGCEQVETPSETPPETPPETPTRELDEALLAQVLAHGVKEPVARGLLDKHTAQVVQIQLDCLMDRGPRDRAATLVRSITDDWSLPSKYSQRQEAQNARQQAQKHADEDKAARALEAQQRAATAQQGSEEEARLDAEFEAMPEPERARIEHVARGRLGVLGGAGRAPAALNAMRRNLQREAAQEGGLKAPPRSEVMTPAWRCTKT